jgi:hypothetical protein
MISFAGSTRTSTATACLERESAACGTEYGVRLLAAFGRPVARSKVVLTVHSVPRESAPPLALPRRYAVDLQLRDLPDG